MNRFRFFQPDQQMYDLCRFIFRRYSSKKLCALDSWLPPHTNFGGRTICYRVLATAGSVDGKWNMGSLKLNSL